MEQRFACALFRPFMEEHSERVRDIKNVRHVPLQVRSQFPYSHRAYVNTIANPQYGFDRSIERSRVRPKKLGRFLRPYVAKAKLVTLTRMA
jgi:hypothetical protein